MDMLSSINSRNICYLFNLQSNYPLKQLFNLNCPKNSFFFCINLCMKQYLESVKSPRKIKVGNITRFKARNNKLFDTLKNVLKLNISSIFSEKWIK